MQEDFIINISENAIEEQRKQLNEKRNQFNEKKVAFDEKNYLNTRLNAGETSRSMNIRILPVSATDPNVFLVLKTHNLKVDKEISKSGYKQFVCLNEPQSGSSDGCPLCEKSKEYFAACKTATSEAERKSLARNGYSYQAKDTFIIRVIERGKENEGVKFWRFNAHSDGTGVYDKLMKIYDIRMNESLEAVGKPYSIFDLKEGRDIKINLAYVETTGRTTIDIVESGFPTPLSKDIRQANAWINDTKSWKDMYSVKSYDYLKIVADGSIPYYNKETNTFVAKSKNEDNQAEIAKEVFIPSETPNPVVTNNIDDLPF